MHATTPNIVVQTYCPSNLDVHSGRMPEMKCDAVGSPMSNI